MLTGTPLQNDSASQEFIEPVAGSFRFLVFPAVVGKTKAGDIKPKVGGAGNDANEDDEDDDWIEREKKAIVISSAQI